MKKKYQKKENNDDALDGHSTIKSWEESKGRGFWGNSNTGYITDDELNDMI